MAIIWALTQSCYYLIIYQLKYFKGDLYTNGIVSAISEVVACITSSFIKEALGLKKSFIFAYTLMLVGQGCVMFISTDNKNFLAGFILTAKFGVAMAGNLMYLANAQIFPVTIVATTIGICNVACRTSSMFSPLIAELKPESISYVYFQVCSVISIMATLRLTIEEEKKEEPEKGKDQK